MPHGPAVLLARLVNVEENLTEREKLLAPIADVLNHWVTFM
jgi:hypothetical protein